MKEGAFMWHRPVQKQSLQHDLKHNDEKGETLCCFLKNRSGGQTVIGGSFFIFHFMHLAALAGWSRFVPGFREASLV